MIDSHHHFWWTDKHTYTWPAEVGDAFDRNYTPDDLRPGADTGGCRAEGVTRIRPRRNSLPSRRY